MSKFDVHNLVGQKVWLGSDYNGYNQAEVIRIRSPKPRGHSLQVEWKWTGDQDYTDSTTVGRFIRLLHPDSYELGKVE